MAFKPERFNGSDSEMAKVNIAFGFGRRACPGQFFADSTIFAIICTILATCNILPEVDKDGCPKYPKIEYSEGFIRYVLNMNTWIWF